jgi:5-amino-6-(5-phosphoribosylamino)uracil reductase
VPDRPYVLLSAAMSADGFLDDASGRRLVLSDAADLDRVDEVRAGCDAILVGAGTIRADNPGLRVRSAARRAARQRAGRPARPARVTLTGSGDLDPTARFFAADGADVLVYVAGRDTGPVGARLGAAGVVVGAGDPFSLSAMLADLAGRGIGRLMVEGGSAVLGQFLAAGLADEFQLAIAPVLVADERAPRLVSWPAGPARWPAGPARWPPELGLADVSRAGRMAVLRYLRRAPGPGPAGAGGH